MKFGEGQPTDHGGRPRKAYSITAMLREYGEQVFDAETGLTNAQKLSALMWDLALNGDRDIAKYIIDRQDGKPKERVEHSESRVLRVTLDDGTDTGQPEAEAVHNESS